MDRRSQANGRLSSRITKESNNEPYSPRPVDCLKRGAASDKKRDRILMFGGAGDSGSTDGKLNVLENARWRTLTDDPTMR